MAEQPFYKALHYMEDSSQHDDYGVYLKIGGPRTVGIFAIVSEEDYGRLSQITWSMSGKYVKCKSEWMHYYIVERRPGLEIDHINRNPLDNRRSNLRYATHAQNCANRLRVDRGIYKGITYHKPTDRWVATVHINKRRKNLGYYPTPEAAALAYNVAARHVYGPYALVNDIPGDEPQLAEVLRVDVPVTRANKSGVFGVSRHFDGRWRASIRVGKRVQYLGLYEDIAEAACVAEQARAERDAARPKYARVEAFP